mmetsp:Transcript_16635/g.49759  ORF Transcript_16635/g.49759 Transcript_16635/m.49759 type:complete len:290 (-) Transcript_16635:663-1532(-)
MRSAAYAAVRAACPPHSRSCWPSARRRRRRRAVVAAAAASPQGSPVRGCPPTAAAAQAASPQTPLTPPTPTGARSHSCLLAMEGLCAAGAVSWGAHGRRYHRRRRPSGPTERVTLVPPRLAALTCAPLLQRSRLARLPAHSVRACGPLPPPACTPVLACTMAQQLACAPVDTRVSACLPEHMLAAVAHRLAPPPVDTHARVCANTDAQMHTFAAARRPVPPSVGMYVRVRAPAHSPAHSPAAAHRLARLHACTLAHAQRPLLLVCMPAHSHAPARLPARMLAPVRRLTP